jgi:hypothetical protein
MTTAANTPAEIANKFDTNWDLAAEAIKPIVKRIGFKRFTHVERMSEETECFTTDITLDGKKIGTAENSGHGGSTFVRIADSKIEAALVSEMAKALVNVNVDHYFHSVDDLIDQAVADEIERRDEEKQVKSICKKFHKHGMNVLRTEQGDFYGYKNIGAGQAAIEAKGDKVIHIYHVNPAFNVKK